MGYYKAGDIIKKTREALGISQEELCDGICAPNNLSRMENGHSKIKMETYRRLMAKMERIPEKIYAVGTGRDMEILEERYYFEVYFKKQEYDKATVYLDKMEKKIGEDIINQQYIKRARALCNYFLGKWDNEKLIEELEEAICLTLPYYKKALKNGMSLSEQELQLIMNIANAQSRKGEKELASELLEDLINYLEHANLIESQYEKYCVPIYDAYARLLRSVDAEYDYVDEIYEKALNFAYRLNDGLAISVIMGGRTDMEIKRYKNSESIQRKLRRAYYFAAARNDERIMEVVLKTYNRVRKD